MNALIDQWNHFWFREAPPHLIAILRITFGLYMLFYWGLRLPHVATLYSTEGLVIPYDTLTPESLKVLLTPPSPDIAYLIFSLFMMSMITFTLGAATRISALISFLFFFYYAHLSLHHMATSYNRLFMFAFLVFSVSDAGKAYSYEMWRKYKSLTAWEPGNVLGQRLIAVQISATYLGVGWQKVFLPLWQGGEVLYYSFQGMWGTALARWTVQQDFPMWMYDSAVFLIKSLEVMLPFGFWFRKFRWWSIGGGIVFHVGTTLFLSAIWWFYAMIACYICFFDPEEIYDALRKKVQWRVCPQPNPSHRSSTT